MFFLVYHSPSPTYPSLKLVSEWNSLKFGKRSGSGKMSRCNQRSSSAQLCEPHCNCDEDDEHQCCCFHWREDDSHDADGDDDDDDGGDHDEDKEQFTESKGSALRSRADIGKDYNNNSSTSGQNMCFMTGAPFSPVLVHHHQLQQQQQHFLHRKPPDSSFPSWSYFPLDCCIMLSISNIT